MAFIIRPKFQLLSSIFVINFSLSVTTVLVAVFSLGLRPVLRRKLVAGQDQTAAASLSFVDLSSVGAART